MKPVVLYVHASPSPQNATNLSMINKHKRAEGVLISAETMLSNRLAHQQEINKQEVI